MKLVIDIPDDEYKFIKDLQSLVIGGRGNCRTIQRDVINAIKKGTPYEELPKGKWYYNYQNGWHCSICNKSVKDMPTVIGKADFNFCPNCGADMRGDI